MRVHAGERVIQDEDTRIANNGAGNGGALLLSAGKGDAAFSDGGFVASGEIFDVAVQTGDFRGLASALGVVIRQAERDISANCFTKKISVLGDAADGAPKRFEWPLLNGMAVEEDGSFRCFPEPRHKSSKSGLAASGGSDDGKGRPGGNFQIDVGKNGARAAAVGFAGAIGSVDARKSGGVGKSEVAKLNFAQGGQIFRKRCCTIVDIRFRRQDEVQAAHGSGPALEDIGDPTKRDHGPDELV